MCLMNPTAVPEYVNCMEFDLNAEIYGKEISPGSQVGTQSPSSFGTNSDSMSSSSSSSLSEFEDDDDDDDDRSNDRNNDDATSRTVSFFEGIWDWFEGLFGSR